MVQKNLIRMGKYYKSHVQYKDDLWNVWIFFISLFTFYVSTLYVRRAASILRNIETEFKFYVAEVQWKAYLFKTREEIDLFVVVFYVRSARMVS